MAELYRRRVGSARPSHLMFTSGVGSLIDLPNFSVLVSGQDDWSYHAIPESLPIAEPRLLAAVQKVLNRSVKELKQAPWMPASFHGGKSEDPAPRVGVPVAPFPGWLRCTACNELAPIESRAFTFENVNVHGRTTLGSSIATAAERRRGAGHWPSLPGSCSPARPAISTTSPTCRSCIVARRVTTRRCRGCGWMTAAATSAPTSRSSA